jgi:hypothetical protein
MFTWALALSFITLLSMDCYRPAGCPLAKPNYHVPPKMSCLLSGKKGCCTALTLCTALADYTHHAVHSNVVQQQFKLAHMKTRFISDRVFKTVNPVRLHRFDCGELRRFVFF